MPSTLLEKEKPDYIHIYVYILNQHESKKDKHVHDIK